MRIIFLALISCFSSLHAFSEVNKGDNSFTSSNCNKNTIERFNEAKYVEIGGQRQWVTINGTDCSNPVVLLIHGGPGNPLSLYHDSLFKDWENQFTVVHWDQRGSGKTYQENHEAGELTVEQLNDAELSIDLLVSDGLEVTDYIRKTLGKDKIVISGTSWGAALAVKMASTNPEKYYFYLGVSQLVNVDTNNSESYDLVMAMAKRKQDRDSIEILDRIGPPPWTNPRSFGKLRRIIREYEPKTVDEGIVLQIGTEYSSEETRTAYFSGEDFSFLKFVGLTGDGMARKIALDECCTEFKIPVYLIQGENDLLATPKVTERYFATIKAPSKEYIIVENVGHDMNYKILDKQLEILKLGMTKFK